MSKHQHDMTIRPYRLYFKNETWPDISEIVTRLNDIFPGTGINPEGGEQYLTQMVERLKQLHAPPDTIEHYERYIGKLPDVYLKYDPSKKEYLLVRYMPEEYFQISLPDHLQWILEKIEQHFDATSELFT